MNSKTSVISNLIVLVAGILLCYVYNRENIPHSIVFISGITLIVPGLINLVLLFSHRDDDRHRPTAAMKVAGWISSVASVGLGVIMVVAPGLFTPILVYLFGAVMILASLMLIYLLSRVAKETKIPLWLFLGPVIVLIAGIVMLCMGHSIADNYITLITGIAMILFSLSWFVASITIAHARKVGQRAVENSDTLSDGEDGQ